MPIRSRLQNTGLKLKIPVRNLNNNNASTLPYNRHSPSPRGGRDSGSGGELVRPLWPPGSSPNRGRKRTVTFDAAVDDRSVWDVQAEKSPRIQLDNYREIPIQIVRNKTTVNILACDMRHVLGSADNRVAAGTIASKPPASPLTALKAVRSISRCKRSPPGQFDRLPQRPGRHLGLSDQRVPSCDTSAPGSPVFDLTPSPDILRHDMQNLSSRARHLKDWFSSFNPPLHHRNHSSVLTGGGGTSDSSILSPTENLQLEHPFHPSNSRRDSSGALQSPDVLDSPKEDGFYLLKKDSQRRETLVKVLRQDKHNICSTWHSLIIKELGDSCLTVGHLGTLMEGMRGYLPEQSKESLETAIAKLKDDLDYDGAKINHLHLALYNFQDAVNAVLRMHSIKPHWMFALDNLVRAAVQAAILVLSPELGAHLADQGLVVAEAHTAAELHLANHPVLDHEAGSTSGVSTVNSGFQPSGHPSAILNSLGRLREENRQLLGDLLQAQHSYQELLRQSLAEQKLHLQLLSQSLAASSLAAKQSQQRTPHFSRQISTDEDSHSSDIQSYTKKVDVEGDSELVAWLTGLSLNQETIYRITGEEITLSDLLDLMSRDDLRRLGLKAGPELRIWRAILQHREHMS